VSATPSGRWTFDRLELPLRRVAGPPLDLALVTELSPRPA
jgi:hypothetical protein